MSKDKRPAWFKMFLHQGPLIMAVPDESAGKALKAAFHYFDDGKEPELDPLSMAVYAAIKPYIDEAFGDYERSSKAGKAGNAKRWGKGVSPPDHPPIHPIAPNPEAEAEAEAEAEKEKEKEKEGECKADKPPTRSQHEKKRFVPPTVEQVAEYVKQRESRVDPQGFIDFYTSKGWMVGKTPMKDWKAACRNAEHWERWGNKTTPEPIQRKRYETRVIDGEEVDFVVDV